MSTQLNKNEKTQSKEALIDLNSFAEEAGVPLSFIKDELMLDGESVDMEVLRQSMLKLVDSTFLKS
jgi:ribosomal protein L7Ae-like RNA K-turn-binding protein